MDSTHHPLLNTPGQSHGQQDHLVMHHQHHGGQQQVVPCPGKVYDYLGIREMSID